MYLLEYSNILCIEIIIINEIEKTNIFSVKTNIFKILSLVFQENCRYLMYKYDISVFARYGRFNDVINCIKITPNMSTEHVSDIASIKELREIRDTVVSIVE